MNQCWSCLPYLLQFCTLPLEIIMCGTGLIECYPSKSSQFLEHQFSISASKASLTPSFGALLDLIVKILSFFTHPLQRISLVHYQYQAIHSVIGKLKLRFQLLLLEQSVMLALVGVDLIGPYEVGFPVICPDSCHILVFLLFTTWVFTCSLNAVGFILCFQTAYLQGVVTLSVHH